MEDMPSPPQSSPPAQGTSILSLPAELRLWIYETALAPTLELAADPWSKFPPWSRFSVLLALALTGKQVGAEVTSLFYGAFAPRARLYFDDAVRLHDFCAWATGKGERVRRLKVLLRVDTEAYGVGEWSFAWEYRRDGYGLEEDSDAQRVDGVELLSTQPGDVSEKYWTVEEFSRVSSYMFRIALAGESGDDESVDYSWTESGLQNGYHHSPRLAGSIGRHHSMTWPPLEVGLELTTYVCIDAGCHRETSGMGGYHTVILEMEGELCTIDFSGFNIAEKRARKYRYTRSFFDGSERWISWPEARCEWFDNRSCSDVDSWAPSSWYASESEESYIYLDEVEERRAKQREGENPSDLVL